METRAPHMLKIFYCYARKDKQLRAEMDLHLSALKRQNAIVTWADHEIAPGEEWERSVDKHLNEADIIFLLVSPDFMGSDYCYSVEMQRALERHEQGLARVVPIILRPVDWVDAPFSKLQVLPSDALPVTSWPNRDAAFTDIVKKLRPMIKELRDQTKTQDDWQAEIEAHMQCGAYADAQTTANHALTLHPQSTTILMQRGRASYELRDYTSALADFDLAHTLEPSAQAQSWRGETYRRLKDYKKALADFDQVLIHKPDYVQALAGRGAIYRLEGKYELALADLNRALLLEPLNILALDTRGDVYRFTDHYKQALADFDHALTLDPHNVATLTKHGDTLLLMKDYKKAIADFDLALSHNAGYTPALIRRGSAYRLLRDYQRALADLESALNYNPNDPSALAARGDVYLSLNQLNAALADFSRAIALDEGDWYLYRRAVTNALLNQREAFEKDIRRAIEIAYIASQHTNSIRESWRGAFNIYLYSLLFDSAGGTAELLYTQLVNVCTYPERLRDAATDLDDLRQVFVSSEQGKTPRRDSLIAQLWKALIEDGGIERIHTHVVKRLEELEQLTREESQEK